MKLIFFPITIILILALSCTTNTTMNNISSPQSEETTVSTVKDEIDLLLSQWEKAIQIDDRDLFLSLFSEDWAGGGYVDRRGKRVEMHDKETVAELRMVPESV